MGINHKQDQKKNVRCDQPKKPGTRGGEGKGQGSCERDGKEREARVSSRAAGGGRTRLIGCWAPSRFKKRWLASRECNAMTNDILCNWIIRVNETPALGPIRKSVITLGVDSRWQMSLCRRRCSKHALCPAIPLDLCLCACLRERVCCIVWAQPLE